MAKDCRFTGQQVGINCGAFDEPRKSSKAIDEHVIINFRDKNVTIARFRDKNVVIAPFRDKNVVIGISVLSIAFLFYKYGKYIWISIKEWEYYPWKSA